MNEFPNEVIDLTPAQEMPRDVPVLGTEPIKAKPKRRRKKSAPKPRAAKTKQPDPILEASKASAPPSPVLQSAQPIEEAPASSIVQGVGADHLVEARENRFKRAFRDPVTVTAPPIKSTWAQRFVFGLRRMTGIDGDAPPVRLSTTLTILLCFAIVGAAAGVARAVL